MIDGETAQQAYAQSGAGWFAAHVAARGHMLTRVGEAHALREDSANLYMLL